MTTITMGKDVSRVKKEEKKVSNKTLQKRREKKNKYFKAISLAVFFVLWQIVCMINGAVVWFNPTYLPSPVLIIQIGIEYLSGGILLKHITDSLYRMLIGFGIGTILSIVIGTLIASFKHIENIMMPIINLFGPIPVYAFLPIFLIWFGIGESSKIILIAYTTVIAMLPYVMEGIHNTDPILIRAARSLGAKKLTIFRKVTFRSAAPNILVGMKACLGLAFSSLLVAEMMGADSGLGYIIVDSKNWFKMADMFMAAILIGLEYTLFYGVLTLVERLLFRWKFEGSNHAIES